MERTMKIAGPHRIRSGFNRLFAAANAHPCLRPSLFERPLAIIAIFALPAAVLMAGSDYLLGVWMGEFPAELRPVAHFVTDLGEGVQVLVTTGLLLLLSALLPIASMRRRVQVGLNAITAAAAFIFLSVAGGGLVALVLKYAIGRARPTLLDSHGYLSFQPFAMDPDFSAFPSGHSATAAAMAISLALVFPRLRALFISIGVLICVSRQLVGMHWMSDTLMGWAVGAAFTYWLAHIFAGRGLMFIYDEFGRLRPRRRSFSPLRFIPRSPRHGQFETTPEAS